jgi:hypothetical protein
MCLHRRLGSTKLGSFWQQQFESTEIISKAIALQSDGEMGCSKTIAIQKNVVFSFCETFCNLYPNSFSFQVVDSAVTIGITTVGVTTTTLGLIFNTD